MWPLPKVRDEFIAVSIDSSQISCAWITSSKKYPAILNAYSTYSLDMFNSNAIEQHLNTFVKKHNLIHSHISIALTGPHIHEQLVRLPFATPAAHDFASPALAKMLWDYRYLHGIDDNQYLFYVCGISRPILFAHQLLAYKTALNLTAITSSYMALLQSYRALFGPAFRQSHMALDMIRTDYKIENAMNSDSIARLLHIKPQVSLNISKEKISLLTLIGLYYQERNTHETY